MVPKNGDRYIILRDGVGLSLSVTIPGLVTISEVNLNATPSKGRQPSRTNDRIIKIHGNTKGNTVLQAKNAAGAVVVKLELGIKDKKTTNVTFNFVKDNAGHKTTRVLSATAQLVATLNYVYNGQANIEIKQKASRWVTIAQNLGQVVRFSSHLPGVPAAQHEWSIVTASGDPTADMNIFFVWEYEQDATPLVDNTDAGTSAANCIFEDNAGVQLGESVAHEIGHFLGCGDHYILARKRELMYGYTDTRGIHIPKQDVNIMNP